MKLTDKEKVQKYDAIVAILGTVEESNSNMKVCGTLIKKQGIKGYKPVEVGEYVYELGDRYILVMETLSGNQSAEVPYYKETLGPYIAPLKAVTDDSDPEDWQYQLKPLGTPID